MRLDPSDLVSRLWGSSALFPEKTLLPGPPDSAPPKQKATSTAAWCPSSVLRCCNAAFRNCFTVNFCPSSTQGTEGNEGNEEHRDDSLHLPQAAAWYKLSLFLFLHFTKISSNFHNFLAATFCITWNIKKHQEIMSFKSWGKLLHCSVWRIDDLARKTRWLKGSGCGCDITWKYLPDATCARSCSTIRSCCTTGKQQFVSVPFVAIAGQNLCFFTQVSLR